MAAYLLLGGDEGIPAVKIALDSSLGLQWAMATAAGLLVQERQRQGSSPDQLLHSFSL